MSTTIFFLLFFFLLLLIPSLSLPETSALLLLKSSFQNPSPSLSSWLSNSSSSSPCLPPFWTGVICFNGLITSLRLRNLNLSGTINISSLSLLPSLRSLSFSNNSFSGPIPDFSLLPALKSLYLSHNRFSGPIPAHLFLPMNHLKKLWIDHNHFSGTIPTSLSKAKVLLELHLESNDFYGELPDLKLPILRTFNVSDNKGLKGRIPGSLVRFGGEAFGGDEGLCGPPLRGFCLAPAVAPAAVVVVVDGGGGKGGGSLFGIGIGVVLVLVVLVVGFVVVRRRGKVGGVDLGGGKESGVDVENGSSGHKRYGLAKGGGSGGGLVLRNI